MCHFRTGSCTTVCLDAARESGKTRPSISIRKLLTKGPTSVPAHKMSLRWRNTTVVWPTNISVSLLDWSLNPGASRSMSLKM